METTLKQLYNKLCLTSVFIGVTQTPLFLAFEQYVTANGVEDKKKAYAAFVAQVYAQGGNLASGVQRVVFEDENVYVKAVAQNQAVPTCIKQSVARELKFNLLTRQQIFQKKLLKSWLK